VRWAYWHPPFRSVFGCFQTPHKSEHVSCEERAPLQPAQHLRFHISLLTEVWLYFINQWESLNSEFNAPCRHSVLTSSSTTGSLTQKTSQKKFDKQLSYCLENDACLRAPQALQQLQHKGNSSAPCRQSSLCGIIVDDGLVNGVSPLQEQRRENHTEN
jgi:hypothetical protein